MEVADRGDDEAIVLPQLEGLEGEPTKQGIVRYFPRNMVGGINAYR